MTATRSAVVLRDIVHGSTRRAVVRDDDGRLALGDVGADGLCQLLFTPTSIDRLAEFAGHAAAGDPAAVTHPKAHLFLSALALAALALLDAGPAGAVAGERTHDDERDDEEGDGWAGRRDGPA